ncbi:MAG: methyltransferase domain-containing protein [Treponema sp.]|jgi:trans-aconitate 2-methyltransferase|nr:methyltransferase domain-containing protein [Treponema sp.]
MFTWDSEQYVQFVNERTQPAVDLIRRVRKKDPRKIIDIGSGPGNSTQVLSSFFPDAAILGIDSSDDMIRAAQQSYPSLHFKKCDARTELSGLGGGFDLVFSNACIQWIPDHPVLIKSMMNMLRPGGILAVQTPMNYDEPIHKIISAVTTGSTWKEKFPRPRVFYNLAPGEYFDLLSGLTGTFTLWQTTYFHRMKSHDAIMEWYRGTGLRPYLSVLSENDKKLFEAEVYAKVVKAYPVQKNGEIIFRFPRFFMLAEKE